MLNFVENDLGLRAPKPGGGWRWDVGGDGVRVRVRVGGGMIQNLKLMGAP